MRKEIIDRVVQLTGYTYDDILDEADRLDVTNEEAAQFIIDTYLDVQIPQPKADPYEDLFSRGWNFGPDTRGDIDGEWSPD
jgi:hypothetical protein